MKVMTDALWIRNGEVGPQPTASTAEMRATVYDQAESASELRAFRKVAAVTGVELAEATLAGLRAGHIILTYTALRGLIERTAHAFATAAKLKKIKDAHVDGPLAPVLELSETIHKALYATQREWTKLVKSDFRKTSVKDVQYVKKPNVANAFSDNILHPSRVRNPVRIFAPERRRSLERHAGSRGFARCTWNASPHPANRIGAEELQGTSGPTDHS
jgi:hypothetical protein